MSISVTENVSCVTDVMTLLSNLGYDSPRRDTGPTLVIDKFDQWANPANGMLTGSCLPSRFDVV
jgi:hypothetical protein